MHARGWRHQGPMLLQSCSPGNRAHVHGVASSEGHFLALQRLGGVKGGPKATIINTHTWPIGLSSMRCSRNM